jgi:DNA-binding response OmpR family regulator
VRVLIVEDEYYLAHDLAEALRARGIDIAGPVGTLEEAEAALDQGPVDRAVLDVNLHGEMSFPIAERLEAAGIPFVIATGYSGESLPERFRGRPRVEKPFRPETLAEIVAAMA